MTLRESFGKLRVLVIGDLIVDIYDSGTSTRNCPDAPDAPVLTNIQHQLYLGGAGNVAANAKALGAYHVALAAYGGTAVPDGVIPELMLRAEIDDQTVEIRGFSPVKERLLIGEKIVARVDVPQDATTAANRLQLLTSVEKEWSQADVVFIADYELGVMSPELIRAIGILQHGDRKTLVIDAKDLREYADCQPSLVTPNFKQFGDLIGLNPMAEILERLDWVKGCRNVAFARTNASNVAVTLDSQGSVLLNRFLNPHFMEAQPIENPKTSGAGDTFAATFGLALAAGIEAKRGHELAQRAAEIACRKPATAVVTIDELEQADPDRPKTVLATGVFDLLHPGHVKLLQTARSLGDRLVVGINSDESTARLKPGRPIQPANVRAVILEALACVAEVHVFDEDTPDELIRWIRPDVFVKGSDRALTDIPEAQTVRECGGRTQIIPYQAGHSTTSTIAKIVERSRPFETPTKIRELFDALWVNPGSQ